MDPKFFEEAREMFLTAGWKSFIEEVEENIKSLRIENLEDEKAFWMAKGQLTVLHQLAGYENFIHHMEAQAEEDNA